MAAPQVDRLTVSDFANYIDSIDQWIKAQEQD